MRLAVRPRDPPMDIHFVSSLTEDDEVRLAAALVGAIRGFLDHYPVAYSMTVQTSGGKTIEHTRRPETAARMPAKARLLQT
jgi:hypothetical protein